MIRTGPRCRSRIVLAGAAAALCLLAAAVSAPAGAATDQYGGMNVTYLGTSAAGIASYAMQAPDDGPGVQRIRVLRPRHPARGMPHNFLFVLPVQAGEATTYGDGLRTLAKLNAQNRYNLTIVEPTFGIDPWYADNPGAAELRHESFMTDELVPWVRAKLSTSHAEQNWLIGFSKSGIGGQDLILRHPRVFALAASWDFPANMHSYDEFGAGPAYGSQSNFTSRYRLTSAFLRARRGPFLRRTRIWIGGYSVFGTDIADYDRRLTRAGIRHTLGASVYVAHRWDSGWIPAALAALHLDSRALRRP